MNSFIEKGVLTKQGMYVELSEKYHTDESSIIDMLEKMNKFRLTQQIGDVLMLDDPKKGLFRRSMLAKFPFMAKL